MLKLAVICFSVVAALAVDYENLGCFYNKKPGLVVNLEGQDVRLDGTNWRARTDAINKCFSVAKDFGYQFFALGGKGQCWAGDDKTVWSNQGVLSSCPSTGKGAYGVVNVYRIGKDWCGLFTADHTMCKYKGPNTAYCEDLLEWGLSAEEQEEVLNQHNVLRQKVASGEQEGMPKAKNMVNLVYDEDLAAVAQRWADQCKFAHDQGSNRRTEAFSWVGQNVHLGYSSSEKYQRTWTQVTNGWYKEVAKFTANGGNVDSFGGVKGVGHFTQEIWATTTHIGCGRVKFHKNGRYDIISVCNYGPGGNRSGKPVYERA